MRRARHRLQVSTFPFLAVLLAAMGSLILLLLVMDRRAKIVARNKAQEAVALHRAAKANADESRRQQEKQVQVEQDTLVRNEIYQLAAASSEVEVQLHNLKAMQERAAGQILELNKDLAAEKSRLEMAQAALPLLGKPKVESALPNHEAERRRLGHRLAELELAIENMKRRKGLEQNTYSLVAYGGKRGQDRQPIYIECLSHAVVLHPGGQVLSRAECGSDRFRAEVARRGASLVKAKPPDPRQPPPPPTPTYVLFLVRPDGIETYYEACNALKGFTIDFGYEFIDAEWVLDFPGEKRTAANDGKNTPNTQYPLLGAPNGAAGALQKPSGEGKAGTGAPYPVPGTPIGAASALQKPGGNGKAGVAALHPGLGPPNGAGGNGQTSLGTQYPVFGTPNGAKGNPDGAKETEQPGKRSQEKGSKSSDLDWRKTPGPKLGGEPTGSQNEISQGQGDPLQRSKLDGHKGASQPGTAAPPLSRVVGNRDFVITLDCFDDRVAISPGGQIMPLAGLESRAQAMNVAKVVQHLIIRRQATVRAGEQPYRPSLRLQVYPDGLRTYFRLVGALEGMGYPMARENVEE